MKCRNETVRNCVGLIAAAVGQPEELLEGWLELYYRVRCAFEPEPEPGEKKKPATKPTHAGNTFGADAAKFKRSTRERLLQLRSTGLPMAKILEAAENSMSERDVRNILDAVPMPIEKYRALAAALDKIEEQLGPPN